MGATASLRLTGSLATPAGVVTATCEPARARREVIRIAAPGRAAVQITRLSAPFESSEDKQPGSAERRPGVRLNVADHADHRLRRREPGRKVRPGTWHIGLQVISCFDREATCARIGTHR
jgi:hypothetical protein